MTDKTIYWRTGEEEEEEKKKHNSADCYIQIRLADIVSLKLGCFCFRDDYDACPALICLLVLRDVW